jgi:GNAT superfamily N-acetyltransferase
VEFITEIQTWSSQARQYSPTGAPGIAYERHELPHLGPNAVSECLLYRDSTGALRGILNHFPNAVPRYEKAGNINVWVDPAYQRKGVATALLQAATQRWLVNFDQQDYTVAGAALVTHFSKSAGR